MGEKPWVAGVAALSLRVKLMRTHLGDANANVSDPICNATYNSLWMQTCIDNEAAYASLDSFASLHKCVTFDQYSWAIRNKPIMEIDETVRDAIKLIKGQLVLWPSNFLMQSDLSPPLATRSLVPNELWV